MSFLQVAVFCGRELGDYFPNQVASTKILVAIAPKVVAAWRVVMAVVCSSVKLVSRRIGYEVTKNIFLEGKSDFSCCSEVVMGVLILL